MKPKFYGNLKFVNEKIIQSKLSDTFFYPKLHSLNWISSIALITGTTNYPEQSEN